MDAKDEKLPIRFIADRETFNDHIYQTGRWERDQIKLVPKATALKMIRHPDTYEAAAAEDAADQKALETVAIVKDTEKKMLDDEKTAELRGQVQKMTKAQAIDYAKAQYKLVIPQTATAEDARARLIQHIDIAGVQ